MAKKFIQLIMHYNQWMDVKHGGDVTNLKQTLVHTLLVNYYGNNNVNPIPIQT